MAARRFWLTIALGALLAPSAAAWSADDAASGSEQPQQDQPAPLLGDDGGSDDPTSDPLERWREEDREEYRDERRERQRLEKELDKRFGQDAPAD